MANVISYKGKKYVRVDANEELSDEEMVKLERLHDALLLNAKALVESVKKFENSLYDNDFSKTRKKLYSAMDAVTKIIKSLR